MSSRPHWRVHLAAATTNRINGSVLDSMETMMGESSAMAWKTNVPAIPAELPASGKFGVEKLQALADVPLVDAEQGQTERDAARAQSIQA